MLNPSSLLLTDKYCLRIKNTFGDAGRQWLDSLPNLVKSFTSKHKLTITHPLRPLSYNYIIEATQKDGTSVIAKFLAPDKDATNEIHALRFMAGDGIVKLLDYDETHQVALLEKLTPGHILTTITEDNAIAITANIMKAVWKPIINPPHTFPTTQQWFARLNRHIDLPEGFSPDLLQLAKITADKLHNSLGELVLLHGDLHHGNILSSEHRQWRAIDPKGIIGEREYEVGAFLRNPTPELADTTITPEQLQHRVNTFSQLLTLDKQRLIDWGFSQAVLAAIWCLDCNTGDWQHYITCAEHMCGCH